MKCVTRQQKKHASAGNGQRLNFKLTEIWLEKVFSLRTLFIRTFNSKHLILYWPINNFLGFSRTFEDYFLIFPGYLPIKFQDLIWILKAIFKKKNSRTFQDIIQIPGLSKIFQECGNSDQNYFKVHVFFVNRVLAQLPNK